MADPSLDPAQVTRSSRSSFLPAFFFLSRPRREALESVYAFCRAVDDVADAPGPQGDMEAALEAFEREVDRAYGGEPLSPLGRGLARAAGFGVAREDLEAVIQGCRMDLAGRKYRTFQELEEYCRKVASSVGRMCVAVFGAAGPGVLEYADVTGLALQLTNILRDIGEDYRRGRVYLPEEDLENFGVAREWLAPGRERTAAERDALETLFRFEAERARRFYARSDALLPWEDRRRLLPGEIMKAVYKSLLGRIERAGADLPERRIRAGRAAKAGAVLGTWIRLGLGLGRRAGTREGGP